LDGLKDDWIWKAQMANSPLRIVATEEYRRQPQSVPKAHPYLGPLPPREENILEQETFHVMLALERRRAERSSKPFLLMLLDLRPLEMNRNRQMFIQKLQATLSNATRETDIIGWYEEQRVLAVIFTEIKHSEEHPITDVLHAKIGAALRENLDSKHVSKLVVTSHMFPEKWNGARGSGSADLKLYPDLSEQAPRKRSQTAVKRAMDIVVSALLLIVLSPVLAVIALAIKLTSPGPIVFRQERMGRFGKPFKFLKFRSMHVNNDHKIHQEFVQSFIAGKAESQGNAGAKAPVYKLTKDPRVTAVGSFLRKTSLDELPQFWNVLRGDMSLVGPRPPVAYEFEVYDFWHRRRVLEVQPGVTGLWQVSGRSSTSFDDMVRLDLRYSQLWSVWLDIKILLATPRAVFGGDGAY
jgi:exopolysaccharide biosynthesis polyprenyl glycosylphosphotransferase